MTQEQEFAKLVLNHPAKDKVLERISANLLQSFRRGTMDERIEVVKILDSIDLFMQELNKIETESLVLNQEEEDAKHDK